MREVVLDLGLRDGSAPRQQLSRSKATAAVLNKGQATGYLPTSQQSSLSSAQSEELENRSILDSDWCRAEGSTLEHPYKLLQQKAWDDDVRVNYRNMNWSYK